MGKLHCALENGADLYVNERQKKQHKRVRSTEERRRRRRKKNAKSLFFTLCGAYVRKLCYHSDVIHSFDWNSVIPHNGGV